MSDADPPRARWREIVMTLPREQVERWSDALIEAGATSVQTEDADADSTDEEALFGEPGEPPHAAGWKRTRLAALLPAEDDLQALLQRTAALLGEAPPGDYQQRVFDDADWVRLSQAQFEPIRISERLVIRPSWHAEPDVATSSAAPGMPPATGRIPPTNRRIQLILDPGLAFGTGSHPTTRLCLRWLEQELKAGERVIDYGCGSGILAIAAARLGAGSVCAIDIDPQALTSTRANAKINGVDLEIQAAEAPAPPSADVVVANILATPLKILAPLLQSLLRPGGALVLAGLLDRQADDIRQRYGEVDLHAVSSEEGWTCLAGRKAR